MSLCNSQLTAGYCHFGRCPGVRLVSRVCLSAQRVRSASRAIGSVRRRPRVARRPSVCPSVCKLLHASRYFYHKHDSIATKLAHDRLHTGLHPGCAQGHGQAERSHDTDTSVMSRNVCYTVPSDVLSPCTHFTKHRYALLPVQVLDS